MTDLRTDWEDNAGQVVDAAFLNAVGALMNANTHARPQYGTFDDRPDADTVTAGTPFYCSDNDTIYRSDGTNWIKVRLGADSCDAMGDVPPTGWTAVNMQSGASWAADKDAMVFDLPSGTGNNLQYQYRTYPMPPFTLTTYIDCALAGDNTPANNTGATTGIVISDGTKAIVFGPTIGYNTSQLPSPFWSAAINKFSSLTVLSAGVKAWPMFGLGGLPKWYRVIDDGTNIQYQYSINGIYWTTLFSEPRTTFLTPSRIGVGGDNYFGTTMTMGVRSWNGVA